MEHYFEHLLIYHRSPYGTTGLTLVSDAYPHLDADYGLLGHRMIDSSGDGMLILWSLHELALPVQQLIDQELAPDHALYNVKHGQSLLAFREWYGTQSRQVQLDYWAVKRANLLSLLGIMSDGTVEYTPLHRVEPLKQPQICQKCRAVAYWGVDDAPLCYLHLLELSRQDANYERDLFNALISPELIEVSTDEVHIKIYTTTCLEPLCVLLNNFSSTLPHVDRDAEIIIELWYARPSVLGGMALTHEGTGYYAIENTTAPGLNAPLLRPTRVPTGHMSSFMRELNEYSERMRKYMEGEHNIKGESNG